MAQEIRNPKKSLTYYMRILHRDVGFLLIGLTLVFSLSGILLVYRPTDLLKSDTEVAETLPGGLSADEIGQAMHLRKLKIEGDDGQHILFSSAPSLRDGSYDRSSGAVSYTEKRLPTLLNRITQLHKSSNSDFVHWFIVAYGVLLTFLAVSSFWMFKPSTRHFRRGLAFAAAGIVAATALVSAV